MDRAARLAAQRAREPGRNIPCDHCPYRAKTVRGLRIHLGIKHPHTLRILCREPGCNHQAVDRRALAEHRLTAHPDKNNRWKNRRIPPMRIGYMTRTFWADRDLLVGAVIMREPPEPPFPQPIFEVAIRPLRRLNPTDVIDGTVKPATLAHNPFVCLRCQARLEAA